MSSSLTSDDPLYSQLFDVAKEALGSGGTVEGDLTPAMNRLREQGTVQKGSLRELLGLPQMHMGFDTQREHYTLFSFPLVERAFTENLLFSSHVYRESPGVRNMGNVILQMIGAEHRRHRAIVQPRFNPAIVRSWWNDTIIKDAVDALVKRIASGDRAELNMDLCGRLPVHVVTRGIGMTGEDALIFRDHLIRSTIGARLLSDEQRRESQGIVESMLMALINDRRKEPRDDVVSALVTGALKQEDGTSQPLSDQEIFGYCRLIMLAGGGTTWRQLGITLHALLTDYHFWEACRDDRSLIGAAIEEGARWMPTDPTFPRLVTEDVELDGVVVPAGARVDLCLGAANRDPARWEDPDRFDLFRPAQHHLGFGFGPHRCLGMHVAKQEMIVAINSLMDRFPNMRLDTEAPAPQLLGGLEQRGMSAIPVRFQ